MDNDLISRSALANVIGNWFAVVDYHPDAVDPFNAALLEAGNEVVASAIEAINNAPAVNTAPKWISVQGRLPEPNVLVLCVWLDGRERKQNRGLATYQRHGVWYVSNEGMPEVTHWMPLPEPPKEADR